MGRRLDVTLYDGYVSLTRPSIWLQTVEILLIAALIDYRTHRAFHLQWSWRFPSLHHRAGAMTSLSAGRMHGVYDLDTRVCQEVPGAVWHSLTVMPDHRSDGMVEATTQRKGLWPVRVRSPPRVRRVAAWMADRGD